jgi:hypothetical protein
MLYEYALMPFLVPAPAITGPGTTAQSLTNTLHEVTVTLQRVSANPGP